MKKVIVTQAYSGRAGEEMSLSEALKPYVSYPHGGVAEHALQLARLNADCIGNLVATLKEKGILTLDEARGICGITDKIEEI